MKLPNWNEVQIDDVKVRGYLLSPSHPVGRFKARVFAALGFTEANAESFIQELRHIAATGEVQTVEDTPYVAIPVMVIADTGIVITDSGRW